MADRLIDSFSSSSIQELSLISVSQSDTNRTLLLNNPENFSNDVFGPVSYSRTPQTLWKSILVKQKENIVVIEKPQEKELEHKKLMDQFKNPPEVFSETLEISRANRALFMQSLMLSTLQSSEKMENS